MGRYQMEMRMMMKKDKNGNFINPEAAAEALAREQMGYLLGCQHSYQYGC